ncbi:MAG: HNH endonuclease [Deltaproteobacteria bacterium]|nr:HNH endonuclease [Deltaproteobacteria bacterium]
MPNEIIPYIEMCRREGVSLQRGMNYQIGGNHSVILMSVRPGAPYEDRYENDGTTIIYEGHDAPKSRNNPSPKEIDQPEYTPAGNLTENGKFHKAAQEYKKGLREPERIRVYEKIKQGIWSYNGVFHLIDSWIEPSNGRNVFKFKLVAVEGEEDFEKPVPSTPKHRRIIPTWVKLDVWKRDGGKCVKCGATEDLHFDHIIPFSKGGSSNTPGNIQLLCGKHNLQKRDKIE